jgi:hypothetical protein
MDSNDGAPIADNDPEITHDDVLRLINEARSHGKPLRVLPKVRNMIEEAIAFYAASHVSYGPKSRPLSPTELVVVDEIHETNVRYVNGAWRFLFSPGAAALFQHNPGIVNLGTHTD